MKANILPPVAKNVFKNISAETKYKTLSAISGAVFAGLLVGGVAGGMYIGARIDRFGGDFLGGMLGGTAGAVTAFQLERKKFVSLRGETASWHCGAAAAVVMSGIILADGPVYRITPPSAEQVAAEERDQEQKSETKAMQDGHLVIGTVKEARYPDYAPKW